MNIEIYLLNDRVIGNYVADKIPGKKELIKYKGTPYYVVNREWYPEEPKKVRLIVR